MPRVSVIVPSYNHGRFLGACLDSVLGQTFQDWELALVDDGSSDDSVNIARAYAERDPRIQVSANKTNLGTYGTQNEALGRTTGEFVAVLNSDDLWYPEKLARQIELMDRSSELPYCYVLGWKCDGDGIVDESDDVHDDWLRDEVQDVLPRLLEENRILASGVMFRREGLTFDSSLRYSGDWAVLLRLAHKSKVGCVPERLTYWRMHGENAHQLSMGQALEEVRVRLAILASRTGWEMKWRDRQQVKVGLGRCAHHLAALAVYFGDMRLARMAAAVQLSERGYSIGALKRAGCCLLPKKVARARLWPSVTSFPEQSNLVELPKLQLTE